MRRWLTLNVLAVLAFGAAAMGHSAPGRCRYPPVEGGWPVVVAAEGPPAAGVSAAEARRAVAAFRRAWRREALPRAGAVARALAPCMRSDAGYYVRSVSGAAAAGRVARLRESGRGESVLWGDPAPLARLDRVWDVSFGGWAEDLVPSGTFGGFVATDGQVIVIVHWPEG